MNRNFIPFLPTLHYRFSDFKLVLSRNYRFSAFTMAMNTNMESDNSWRGVPLSEIRGSLSPWGAPEFPLVAPAFNHTVLYHIPSSGFVPEDRPPKPQIGQDKWDHDFVRMPFSTKSLYPVEDITGETHLKKRWELIEHALRKPMRNSQQLAETILSYNTQFKNTWKFRAMHKLFDEHLEEEESQYFFDVTLPEIAKLALALPKLIQAPIPLLKQHKNHSISLTQQQISSLLANAFFCTFPRRNSTKKTSEYASFPYINFISLYETSGSDSVLEKLKCLCHYFKRVCSKAPGGVVTVSRRWVGARRWPAWPRAARRVAAVPLHVDPAGAIEDADSLIQMDFANKYLGGGVLGHGCVQEEIRFVICPELMVTMLFTEMLRPDEALMIIGCERYSRYSGYGASFQWAGAFEDGAPRDSSARRRTAVLALDALPYAARAQQYRPPAVLRELNKAWIGFSFYSEEHPPCMQFPGVATGNWGCGAFGGSPDLKALLQLMACAEARRPCAYYTFQDTSIRDELISAYNLLARYNVTVGQLYNLIIRFCQTDVRKSNLHAFIEKALRDEREPNPPAKPQEKEPPELMDSSAITDVSDIELSESLKQEFLNQSPDMFEDETPTQETQFGASVKLHETKNIDDSKKALISSQNKEEFDIVVVDSEMDAVSTSDLFIKMNKFDQSNGKLNLSTSHTSFLKISESPKVNCSKEDTVKETKVKPTDSSSEVKKKLAGKITDYFRKESL